MQGSSLNQRRRTSPHRPQPQQAATTNHHYHHHVLTNIQHCLVPSLHQLAGLSTLVLCRIPCRRQASFLVVVNTLIFSSQEKQRSWMFCLLVQFIERPRRIAHLNIQHGKISFEPCEALTRYLVARQLAVAL